MGHWTTRVVGTDTDPLDIFVWARAWWPYALTHSQNPFVIHGVWTPLTANAGWRTVVPALSVAAMPLTLSAGPVASYNLMMLLAPVLTATAMCLVIMEISGPSWIAVWAGYVVGFSALVVLSPWLWSMFNAIRLRHVDNSRYATNLLNLIIPTRVTMGGQWLQGLTRS